MTKSINILLKYIITLGLGLVPFISLYVANSLYFPFITGKAFAFRIIIEVIFALWLILMLRDRKFAPRFSWLLVAVTAFTIIVLLADLLGVNPIRSIWSNSERMEGWLVIAHLWAYFIVATSMFGSGQEGRRLWHIFLNVILFAAIIVGIYGVAQLFNKGLIHQGSSRIDASLGNAAYMAVYMLIHTFIALYMSFMYRERKMKILFWIYIILAAFFAFLVFETATRGTILGLIGGIMLSLFLYSIFGKGEKARTRFISGGIILLIILLGVIFWLNRNASFVKNNETLSRLASISISDTKTQARAFIWPMALKGSFETPKTAIMGWGQENFNYIFNKYYNPAMWRHEQWFDRAHSVFLDWLVAGGLIGLLSYLSLYVIAIFMIWKSDLSISQKSLLTGLVAAYAVHNIFVFDNLISYILFFTVLGFIHSLKERDVLGWLKIKGEQTEESIIIRDYIYMPVTVIIFAILLYALNIRPIKANENVLIATAKCGQGYSDSLDYFKNALSYNQYVINQEAREQLVICAQNIMASNATSDIKKGFSDLTQKSINDQIKVTPEDARIYMIGGSYYNQTGGWVNAENLLSKAVELSPNKESIAAELTISYINEDKYKEANDLMEKTYNLATDNPTSMSFYAATLILTNQEKKAKEIFKDNPEVFQEPIVTNAYVRTKQYNKVVEIYKAMATKNPDDFQSNASLAAAYLANGQRYLAIDQLNKMKDKFPQYQAQIDDAIKQIQMGKVPGN